MTKVLIVVSESGRLGPSFFSGGPKTECQISCLFPRQRWMEDMRQPSVESTDTFNDHRLELEDVTGLKFNVFLHFLHPRVWQTNQTIAAVLTAIIVKF